jgi:hypothetical protein
MVCIVMVMPVKVKAVEAEAEAKNAEGSADLDNLGQIALLYCLNLSQ